MPNDWSVQVGAEPLSFREKITVKHVGGHTGTVEFQGLQGEKLDRCYVRWGLAGEYEVVLSTGQLLGGKPRKKASVWRVIESDLERIEATRIKLREERYEKKCQERHGR